MKLEVELVPKTSWFSNLRSVLSQKDWDTIRKSVYKEANYRCQICNGVGPNWPVECHETWMYHGILSHSKGGMGQQALVDLVALCPACHQCKHFGFAQVRGNFQQVLDHFSKVNGISVERAKAYFTNAMDIWRERSKIEWELDLSYIKERYGIEIKEDKTL